MHSGPLRISEAVCSAIRAARSAHKRPIGLHVQDIGYRHPCHWGVFPLVSLQIQQSSRWYSDSKRNTEVEEKVQNVKDRIDESLELRAQTAANAEPVLSQAREETIVHTHPEASSIVHSRNSTSESLSNPRSEDDSSGRTPRFPQTLPSQTARSESALSKRFSSFMDHLQSQVFVASRRLNDLTGYTGIERLKMDIESQESSVQSARQRVKDGREAYSRAIAMRSTTQKEVNDLLHRKHNWGPDDLQRFTELYRSDHANEQAEQKAQQELSHAENQYEEASTKLAKSILARYHEEQIWSDKIRQMSTWGTWSLMGLNLLLFLLLQIAIEPWRRRRLVRGFEEKVEQALAAQDGRQHITSVSKDATAKRANETVASAADTHAGGIVALASERMASAVVDAVSGTTGQSGESPNVVSSEKIESTADLITTQKLQAEGRSIDGITTVDDFGLASAGVKQPQSWRYYPIHAAASLYNAWSQRWNAFLKQFDDQDQLVLSRRNLTTRVLEGIAIGAALAGGVSFAIVRGR